jgi:hypothetical protein
MQAGMGKLALGSCPKQILKLFGRCFLPLKLWQKLKSLRMQTLSKPKNQLDMLKGKLMARERPGRIRWPSRQARKNCRLQDWLMQREGALNAQQRIRLR